jgi:hypothetical protein
VTRTYAPSSKLQNFLGCTETEYIQAKLFSRLDLTLAKASRKICEESHRIIGMHSFALGMPLTWGTFSCHVYFCRNLHSSELIWNARSLDLSLKLKYTDRCLLLASTLRTYFSGWIILYARSAKQCERESNYFQSLKRWKATTSSPGLYVSDVSHLTCRTRYSGELTA